eukprot:1160959-Pelagomonas_calceolata.AAC.7
MYGTGSYTHPIIIAQRLKNVREHAHQYGHLAKKRMNTHSMDTPAYMPTRAYVGKRTASVQMAKGFVRRV